MSNRKLFISRVKQAAERGRQYRVHVRPFSEEVGYLGAGGDLCQRFAEEVSAVGGAAFVVEDIRAAGEVLSKLLKEFNAKTALCWQHELLRRLGLNGRLDAAGIGSVDYASLAAISNEEQRRVMLACDVGITSCDCAIAETGTLMMCSQPGQERVASLIAPVHIAIVERQQIVPDLIDAFQLLQDRVEDGLPSNVTFITGPSKTGDIELQLTTGVHGPGKWRVIVVAEEGNRE